MFNIFLDDERFPSDVTWINLPDVKWVVLRTSFDFKFFIEEAGMSNIGYISFDHDINDYSGANGSEVTGYDLLKWLIDNDLGNLPKCLFHSKNPIGKKNMEMYYNNYLKHKAKSGD